MSQGRSSRGGHAELKHSLAGLSLHKRTRPVSRYGAANVLAVPQEDAATVFWVFTVRLTARPRPPASSHGAMQLAKELPAVGTKSPHSWPPKSSTVVRTCHAALSTLPLRRRRQLRVTAEAPKTGFSTCNWRCTELANLVGGPEGMLGLLSAPFGAVDFPFLRLSLQKYYFCQSP